MLDPDGMADGWLYVVVEAPTGVIYQQQYGGTACRQGQVEGYLVPVFGPDALDSLRTLFERHFRGAGAWHRSWSAQERDRFRDGVEGITFWACDGHTEEPHALKLDENRMADTDEAWVPVLTPDGAVNDRDVNAATNVLAAGLAES
ncbi:hypothetical protein Acsp04_17800 [Actinomadura sp. NBRC 104425]|uniref:DUF6210 family protein n=1 Tax=Actinomadura sp. NBRC 104425 TaxID=3032204 RepID=UPI0024A0F3A8|nr:DUF6210 family protein [Actinomadura sp. NBRC 104425]GLZ11545.1 hypothetical protein Acsp04_17800 [Actinomadura sp. NBRC 104425]